MNQRQKQNKILISFKKKYFYLQPISLVVWWKIIICLMIIIHHVNINNFSITITAMETINM